MKREIILPKEGEKTLSVHSAQELFEFAGIIFVYKEESLYGAVTYLNGDFILGTIEDEGGSYNSLYDLMENFKELRFIYCD